MHILVTRPEPDASEQADELRLKGYDVVIAPMLTVKYRELNLGTDSVDPAGLIVTSRNALRALQRSPVAPNIFDRPVYCVGSGTAKMARTQGFQNVISGNGNSEDLTRLIRQKTKPDEGVFLRLTGKIPSNAPNQLSDALIGAGYAVTDVVCYEVTAATRFAAEVRAFLAAGHRTCVILMSPLTAKSFQSCLCNDGLTVQSGNFRYICLSKAVADVLSGVPSAHIFVADKPNRTGLGSILDRAVADLS